MREVIRNHPLPFEEPEKNLDGDQRPGNGSRGISLLFGGKKIDQLLLLHVVPTGKSVSPQKGMKCLNVAPVSFERIQGKPSFRHQIDGKILYIPLHTLRTVTLRTVELLRQRFLNHFNLELRQVERFDRQKFFLP